MDKDLLATMGNATALRVGFGYDVHQLVRGQPLIIGGIQIPHTHGLAGHSDADVLLHAIADALLGAAAQRDIGHHFPGSDDRWKGTRSTILLRSVAKTVEEVGYRIVNVDATVGVERPRLGTHIENMRKVIAQAADITPAQVSVKATTTDMLGFVGRREGIAAWAVCLIEKV